MLMTTSQLPSDSGSAPTSPCRIDVKEAECYDIAWQEWLESGHEYGVRDKEFLDRGLYDILNFLLIYVRKGK